jgi:hypothetical protein
VFAEHPRERRHDDYLALSGLRLRLNVWSVAGELPPDADAPAVEIHVLSQIPLPYPRELSSLQTADGVRGHEAAKDGEREHSKDETVDGRHRGAGRRFCNFVPGLTARPPAAHPYSVFAVCVRVKVSRLAGEAAADSPLGVIRGPV